MATYRLQPEDHTVNLDRHHQSGDEGCRELPTGETLDTGEELRPRKEVEKCWKVDRGGAMGAEGTWRVPHRGAPPQL
jgi:hypothetical protein